MTGGGDFGVGLRLYRDVVRSDVIDACASDLIAFASCAKWRRTGWLPTGARPRNLVEQLVVLLASLVADRGPFAGAEWWLRAASDAESKALHFDKDEALYTRRRIFAHPVLATVFYVTDSGGETLVLDQRVTPRTHVLRPPRPRAGVVVRPKRNQLLVFPGGLRHGVAAGTSRRRAAARVTLLVNFWRKKPLAMKRMPAAIDMVRGTDIAGRTALVPRAGSRLGKAELAVLTPR